MKKQKGKRILRHVGLCVFVICIVLFILPFALRSSYNTPPAPGVPDNTPPKEVVKHLDTPEPMKAIYMTACVAGTPSWRASLKKLVEETELNSIIIDIKDYSGTISFIDPDFPQEGVPGCRVSDMKEFLKELHESDIYTIGRITVFQDPYYTKLHPEYAVKKKSDGGIWKDHKGLAFIDVGAKPYWDHVIALSKKSYELGFDELNFDYIRYPSDGNMKDALYTWTLDTTVGSSTSPLSKPEMLKTFFKYLDEGLNSIDVVTSADLFGMTTTNNDDLGIGQILENALLYFDYVYPMVYPSHYPATWNGLKNPAANPYEVIKLAMQGGLDKERALRTSLGMSTTTPSKLRPWIQDFDLGATYGVAEVQAQMKATYDVGITSWLSWDASNKYTTGAYLPE
jgi:hypothetical protein